MTHQDHLMEEEYGSVVENTAGHMPIWRPPSEVPLLHPRRTDRKQGLAGSHPHIMQLWSSRNKTDPESVTASSHRIVEWICPKGHRWQARIFSVAQDGCRCPYCAGKAAIPGETDLATVRPDLLVQWDWERNRGLTPDSLLPSTHTKAWWRCDKGHQWEAAIFSRTREKAARCPYCTGKKVLAGFNDLATLFPDLTAQWHPDLNGDLRPDQLSPGSNKKVWWRCTADHTWQAAVYSRTRKKPSGCPVCAGMAKEKTKR